MSDLEHLTEDELEHLQGCEACGVLDAYEGKPHNPTSRNMTGAERFAYSAGYWNEKALELMSHE